MNHHPPYCEVDYLLIRTQPPTMNYSLFKIFRNFYYLMRQQKHFYTKFAVVVLNFAYRDYPGRSLPTATASVVKKDKMSHFLLHPLR